MRAISTAASDAEDGLLPELQEEEPKVVRQGGGRRVVVGVIICAGLLGAAAILSWRPQAAAGAADADSTISLAAKKKADKKKDDKKKEDKKKKPIVLYPKPMECSASSVQDCSDSQCCKDFGYQCYTKNASFAACLKGCEANGTWSCKKLGHLNKCAGLKDNCLLHGCCADVGHQCYAKNAEWGACMTTCDSSAMAAVDSVKGAWSCDPIGLRNTMDYRDDYEQGEDHHVDHMHGLVQTSPWVKNCSHLGENCASTKCCAWTGYECYQKDANFAGCLRTCFPGKWNGGVEKPMAAAGKPDSNPPAHWNVTFSPAPEGPWTCKHLTIPKKPGHLVGTSLYCFTVALSENGNGKKLEELDILKEAQRRYTHVFACDHWTVFSNIDMALNPGKTVKVVYPHGPKRPNTKIYVNVPLFLNVWGSIRQATTWRSFPWIVKSDPSAVFIPGRLRSILAHQLVTDKGVFLENCKEVRMSFHGSLEVMSNVAFSTFLNNIDHCNRTLPWDNGVHAHFRYYGEDKFAAWCMEEVGVDKVPSLQVVETVPKDQPVRGLHLTVSCPGHRTNFELHKMKWHPNCTRSQTAGLHAFRSVKKWTTCLNQTLRR